MLKIVGYELLTFRYENCDYESTTVFEIPYKNQGEDDLIENFQNKKTDFVKKAKTMQKMLEREGKKA